MDFFNSFESALGVLRRDTASIVAVSQDQGALVPGLLFASLAGFLSGLPRGMTGSLLMLVVAPVAVFSCVFVLFLIARLFGGSGSYMTLWRPCSHAYLLNAVGIVLFVPVLGPIVAIIATIYFLIVLVSIVQVTQHISRGRAIAVAVIPLGLSIVLYVLVSYNTWPDIGFPHP